MVNSFLRDPGRSVLVIQLGARNHYAAPIAFYNNNMLRVLYTDFYYRPDSVVGSVLHHWHTLPRIFQPSAIRRGIGRRKAILPDEYIKTFSTIGLVSTILLPLKKKFRLSHLMANIWGSAICILASQIAPKDIRCVYAFNGGALEIFHWARKHNIVCILEQVSAPKGLEQDLLRQEYLKWPDWERTVSPKFVGAFAKRERKEWQMADLIISPSSFVHDGLRAEEVPESRIAVVPYGVDLTQYVATTKLNKSKEYLNVLFVGAVNVHKGIQYLFEAVKDIPSEQIRVRVAGGSYLTPEANIRLAKRCELLGLVPRLEMPSLYQWADVVVLPSVCEGSALVTYEALATGTPVITTTNAGSIVEHGKSGFITPHGDSAKIGEYLLMLRDSFELRQKMSKHALVRIQEYGALERYQERLVQIVRQRLDLEPRV